MKIYDNNYENDDYSKMMEETGKMLNQFESLKNQANKEYDEILKIKLIPEDCSDMSLQEYEEMLEERNSMINVSLNNLKMLDSNINYLKEIGISLLVKTGVMSEEDYRNSKLLNFLLETMEEKNRYLQQANTIIDEYNELKFNKEVDMVIVTEDSNSYKNYKVSELEEKYNEDSSDIEKIDKALFELEMIKSKLVNDLGVLTYLITPKENENSKTKKKKRGNSR